jgi:hypothetical protein
MELLRDSLRVLREFFSLETMCFQAARLLRAKAFPERQVAPGKRGARVVRSSSMLGGERNDQ